MKVQQLQPHLHLLLFSIAKYQELMEGKTPSLNTLATELGNTPGTIRAKLTILKNLGFINYNRIDEILILMKSTPISIGEPRIEALEGRIRELQRRIEKIEHTVRELKLYHTMF